MGSFSHAQDVLLRSDIDVFRMTQKSTLIADKTDSSPLLTMEAAYHLVLILRHRAVPDAAEDV